MYASTSGSCSHQHDLQDLHSVDQTGPFLRKLQMPRCHQTPGRHLNHYTPFSSLYLDGHLVSFSNTVPQGLSRRHPILLHQSYYGPHHHHSSQHLSRTSSNIYRYSQRETVSNSTVQACIGTSLSSRTTATSPRYHSLSPQRPSEI